MTSVEKAGEVAGRMYALSTAGSILGTFLPVAVLIPLIGTRRTMLATAAAAGRVAPRPRWAAVTCWCRRRSPRWRCCRPGLVKQGDGVIYEAESPYQFIQVVQQSDGERVLHLNEGWADHSRLAPRPGADRRLLGPLPAGAAAARRLRPSRPGDDRLRRRHASAGPTAVYWPAVNVLGIEMDGDVTAAGRRYLGLDDNPRVRVATADGRTYLSQHDRSVTTPSSWTPSASPTSPST